MIQLKEIDKDDSLCIAFGFTTEEATKIRMVMARAFEETDTWTETMQRVIKDIDDDTKIAYVMFEFGRLYAVLDKK